MADSPTYPGAPRWAKVFGLIALVLVVLFLVLHLTGHGMGRHAPFGDHMPSGSQGGNTQPESGHR